MADGIRRVKLAVAVQARFAELERTVPKFKETYSGLEWLLVRLPEVGEVLNYQEYGETLRYYDRQADPATKSPGIIIAYSYIADAFEVLMLDITRGDDQRPSAGFRLPT